MDLSKYAALFLAESREHLSTCNLLLLEWEREPEAVEPVAGLFRAIHTIKGMAATMGYSGVADLAHRMENLLDGLRQGRVAPGADVFQLMFRSVDALTRAVEGAAAGDQPAEAGLTAELDAAAGGEHTVAGGERTAAVQAKGPRTGTRRRTAES
ncbi:MAG TPA: Hpt domain-containing protein, partial [Gemmatimonadales bacterium]|nr:Hpt domain-containing protein [Gemmatimonadales bacterium]